MQSNLMASRRTQTMGQLPVTSLPSQFTLSSSSSFRSLTNPSAIKQKMLPRYMREKGILLSNPALQSLPFSRDQSHLRNSEGKTHQRHITDGDFERGNMRVTVMDEKELKKIRFERLLGVVNEGDGERDEVVLRYEKGGVTRGEFQELLDRGDASMAVLQAFFYALKKENCKLTMVQTDFPRVKLYKPGTCQCIFALHKAEQTHVQTDPFSYE